MSSKLGIIAIEWQSDAIGWAIQNKPTAFEFMMTQPLDSRPMYDIGIGTKVSQIEAVKILAENSPKTLLIIRAYPDDYDHSDFQDRMLKWSEPFRKVSNRVVAHSVNEPVVFNPDMAKRLNEYEVGFIRRMATERLLPMCFCLSESHLVGPTLNENGTIKDWGNLPLWWYMKDGMALLAEKHGFWGLNEYDWSSWCASRDRGRKWRLGHWEVNLDVLQRHLAPLQIPLIGIGEGVLDGKIWTSRLPQSDHRYNKPWGWQYAKSSPQHLADIKGIYADSYQNPKIAFHLMFAWAPNHRDWGTYDVSRMKDLLAQYLQENLPIYWEPREEEPKMDVWGNAEKYRPDVAKFKKQIGDATRDYPVPIPDYKGIAASPAKTMAVIIAHEGNPANPNQVVEFDEKKDGKPTGRKLHAVGLCGIVAEHTGKTVEQLKDPYTNIIEGLKILQSKLKAANGVLRGAYYYYTGGSYWPSMEDWVNKIWLGKFVPTYKQFWGVNLEPAAPPDWEAKYKELRSEVEEKVDILGDTIGEMDRTHTRMDELITKVEDVKDDLDEVIKE